MTPEQLGPYRLVGTLGRGGMGTVYQGVNVETDKPAAVKILAATLAGEQGFRQRFEAEIEALRKLCHPNIVQLFGFGEQDGILFYAMELVEGNSLEDELRRGRRFDWREAARIGIQTCRALRHAHDRGVIHRDLKPANLLLTEDGRVKLSDFGIARLFGQSGMTAAGSVLGTVEYMAPEQCDGRPVGPRSDLYSLGGVLFALLAGRPPFKARSLVEMLEKQRLAVPEPVRRFEPDTPEELEQIILQLLEKDPDKRINNATLLARRLEAMLHALALRPMTKEAEPREPENPDLAVAPLPKTTPAAAELPRTRLAGDSAGRPTAEEPPAAEAELPPTRLATDVQAQPLAEPRPPQEPFSATRTMDGPEQWLLVARRAAEGPPPETTENQPPVVVPSAAPPVAPSKGRTIGEGFTADRTQGRFVAVPEEDLDRAETKDGPHALISLHTWVLAGALIAIGLAVWYALRPPTADVLSHRIAEKTVEKSIDSILDAERDIQEFVVRFPTDPRAEQFRGYQREIELHRLERMLDLRAKGRASSEGLLPIERAYIRAINQAWLDPEEGLARLQALVDLYKDRTDLSGPASQCLELAQRHVERLGRQMQGATSATLGEVELRLQRAEEIRLTDPAAARAIWRAVIELYQDRPWAADVVRRARAALAAEEKDHKDTKAQRTDK